MRIGRPSWLHVILASLPLGGSPFGAPEPAAAQLAQPVFVTQARALEIARQHAALQGYPPAGVRVVSVEHDEAGTWVVRLECDAPDAPDRRCTVYVHADGSSRLVRGR